MIWHWCRKYHPNRHYASTEGRPLEVLIPFRGSPVIGPNDEPIREKDNNTYDHLFEAGFNVTFQHPRSPHVFAFHSSKTTEENEFGLHVLPNLIWVHLPERCGGNKPLDHAVPVDQLVIDRLAELLCWAVNRNGARFIIEVPVEARAKYKPMLGMALLGKLKPHTYHSLTIDMCAFLTKRRGSLDIITNEASFFNDCHEFYNHDYRNSWPHAEAPCLKNHGGLDDPNHPDRRLPYLYVKRVVRHFLFLFEHAGCHRNEQRGTTFEGYISDGQSHEKFVQDASRQADRNMSFCDWRDLVYQEYCDDHYY